MNVLSKKQLVFQTTINFRLLTKRLYQRRLTGDALFRESDQRKYAAIHRSANHCQEH